MADTFYIGDFLFCVYRLFSLYLCWDSILYQSVLYYVFLPPWRKNINKNNYLIEEGKNLTIQRGVVIRCSIACYSTMGPTWQMIWTVDGGTTLLIPSDWAWTLQCGPETVHLSPNLQRGGYLNPNHQHGNSVQPTSYGGYSPMAHPYEGTDYPTALNIITHDSQHIPNRYFESHFLRVDRALSPRLRQIPLIFLTALDLPLEISLQSKHAPLLAFPTPLPHVEWMLSGSRPPN